MGSRRAVSNWASRHPRPCCAESSAPPAESMNIALIREGRPFDRRVALTPPVVRHLVEAGHAVWVESGAGEGAWFQDAEYARTGARIVYSQDDALHRSDLVARISTPVLSELRQCPHGMILMAFYHMAVADRVVLDRLMEQSITAIGLEMIQQDDGRLPVLRAVSEIAGQMTVPIAAHLLRSSSGGRGVLLGGSPGIPPASVVILGAGVVGTWAARTACAAGAHVTVLDVDAEKLRKLMERIPTVETCLAESESVAAFVASADVVIGIQHRDVRARRPSRAGRPSAHHSGPQDDHARGRYAGTPAQQHAATARAGAQQVRGDGNGHLAGNLADRPQHRQAPVILLNHLQPDGCDGLFHQPVQHHAVGHGHVIEGHEDHAVRALPQLG